MSDPADGGLRASWDGFRPWLPDATLGALVLVAGLLEQSRLRYLTSDTHWNLVVLALVIALAVGLARRAPGFSLVLVWFICSVQVWLSVPLLLIEAAVVVVAFGAARWGNHVTVALSGLSIPVAGFIAVSFLKARGFADIFDSRRFQAFYDTAQRLSDTWQIGAGVFATACLAVPWMAGLVLRYSNRAATSLESKAAAEAAAAQAQRESHQAHEIARLREEQTKLAHDVHDVVGHSLAVILAQAESAQFLDEADTGALRLSMQNIASSARSSLQDVRQVLTPTPDVDTGLGSLNDLVDGVRASGHVVRSTESGTPRPLPPEIALVAYRVLQEMLTNAIRHGAREQSTGVGLHWSDELRIEVANVVGEPVAGSDPSGGQGLSGMRRRLESIGGRLDVVRRDSGEHESFTTIAHVPLRTVYP
ncbi:MAG: Signal transduction histidine kinase [Marmoricola sp.]|nr:Signal transduction histidine kinase [Marmoricola sp.]